MPQIQLLLIILIYSGVLGGVTGFTSILPVYIVSGLGVGISVAALLTGAQKLPGVFSQLWLGRLSDDFGRRTILIIITTSVCLSTVVVSYAPFGAIFIAAMIAQFFFGAAFFPVMLAGISDIASFEERTSKIGIALSRPVPSSAQVESRL